MTPVTDPVRTVDRLASGVVSTFGAGLFLGIAPASALAGSWLVAGLVLAAALAVLFALSTPDVTPGVVAPALGILGRIAAGTALAGTFSAYVLPASSDVAAVTFVVAVAAVVLLAPPPSGFVNRVGAVVVLAVLAIVAVACFAIEPVPPAVAPPATAPGAADPLGMLPAAALLFVCFVGAGVPTRRDRLGVIGVVLVGCGAVAAGVLWQLGGERLALSSVPLRDALAAADAASVGGLLAVGVTVACGFALHGALSAAGAAGDLVPALRRGRPRIVPVGLAAGLVALGALLVEPVHALVGAAVLLLGEAGFRVLAGRARPA